MKLSVEELKKYSLAANKEVASMALEIIALRELKGEQVPVAVVEYCDYINVGEPRRKAVRELYEGALVIDQELFTAPQKPVVLPNYRNSPDMHTKQYYETIGFNLGLDACKAAIEAAGGKVAE